MSAVIIAVVNQKGGVGKTTTTVNLSAALSVLNQKILLIDLDPQANSSSGLGLSFSSKLNTIYHALSKLNPVNECITKTNIPNLDIIASDSNLSAAEVELVSLKRREYLLKDLLKELEKIYDYIIIDCPPSLNLLTVNALCAASELIIPMQCEFFSLSGLSSLLKTIELIKNNLNPKISINGILFTMYDKRSKLTEAVEKDVRFHLGDLVYKTIIPRNIKLSEAPSFGKPAIIYDYKCSGSLAYMQLTKEILNKRGIDICNIKT